MHRGSESASAKACALFPLLGQEFISSSVPAEFRFKERKPSDLPGIWLPRSGGNAVKESNFREGPRVHLVSCFAPSLKKDREDKKGINQLSHHLQLSCSAVTECDQKTDLLAPV